MNTSLEISVLASRIDSDIFETIKQEAINHNLKYEENETILCFDSFDGGGIESIKIIKIIGPVIAGTAVFINQMQPTLQELIKAKASQGITVICGNEQKIDIKGDNEIEKVLEILEKFDCDPKQ